MVIVLLVLPVQLKTAEVQYSDVLMCWLVVKTKRDKECSKAAFQQDKARKNVTVENEIQYQVSRHTHFMTRHTLLYLVTD